MNEIERIIEDCIECGECVEECEFLARFCVSPKELALKFRSDYFREKLVIPYSCNICELCKSICPEGLNPGEMFMGIRLQLFKEGTAPLPPHRLVIKNQEWVTSDSFTLTLTDSRVGDCKRAFFPGCNLVGYSPSLVIKTYDYLLDRLPGTGIILNCCGAPTYFMGDESGFKETLGKVETEMEKIGASELIVACPNCYHTFKHNSFRFQLRSIYEVMVEEGLPKTTNPPYTKTFSIHDSCKARYESSMQENVRTLVNEMGHRVEEMKHSRDMTRCCGMGGMVPFVNFKLAYDITKRRTDETSLDMVSYCASCRDAFASLKKPSLHILDLVFNPDWEKDSLSPAKKGSTKQENQSQLKLFLEKRE